MDLTKTDFERVSLVRTRPQTTGLARRPRTVGRASERGVIVIWALLTAFLIAGIIIAATDEMRAIDETAEFDFSASGQAEEVAQAGLTDAFAWFRRQSPQPVTGFAPKGLPPSLRDVNSLPPDGKLPKALRGTAPSQSTAGAANSTAMPPGLAKKILDAGVDGLPAGLLKRVDSLPAGIAKRDGQLVMSDAVEVEMGAADFYSLEDTSSETPELGLVRTFEISPGIWARYTVNKGEFAENYADTNQNGVYDRGEPYEDTNGDGKWTPGSFTRDVSTARGLSPMGAVWYLTSVGEIFRKADPAQALGDGPNVRLAVSVWGTEIRRLTIAAPAAAALCVQSAKDVEIGDRTRLLGTTAIAYAQGSGSVRGVMTDVKGGVTGMPEFASDPVSVFGVEWAVLMSMADISTSDSAKGLPGRMPAGGLVVVNGDTSFDRARPLKGSAVVAVQGDVSIEAGSGSYFSGVLYVDGDLTVRGPALLRGTVIVTGKVDVQGTGSDFVSIEHDSDQVNKLLLQVAQYRPSKAPFRIKQKMDTSGMVGDPAPRATPTSDPGPDEVPDPDSTEEDPDAEDPCANLNKPVAIDPADEVEVLSDLGESIEIKTKSGKSCKAVKTKSGKSFKIKTKSGKSVKKSKCTAKTKFGKSKSLDTCMGKTKSAKVVKCAKRVKAGTRSAKIKSKSGKTLCMRTKSGRDCKAYKTRSGKTTVVRTKSGKTCEDWVLKTKSGKHDYKTKSGKSGKRSCGAFTKSGKVLPVELPGAAASGDTEVEPDGGCDGADTASEPAEVEVPVVSKSGKSLKIKTKSGRDCKVVKSKSGKSCKVVTKSGKDCADYDVRSKSGKKSYDKKNCGSYSKSGRKLGWR